MDRRSDALEFRGRTNKSNRQVVRAYLQLCEDQVDLRRLGRVTDSTWRFWRQAILDQCAERPYRVELSRSSPEMYSRLRDLIATGDNYDPLHRRHWGRWRRGLAGE